MVPVGATLRTTQLPVSAMYRLPSESSARPVGPLSNADVAGPPSPPYPGPPVPAKVVITPWGEILRTTEFPESATYRSPEVSGAIPTGPSSDASTAGPPSPEYPGRPFPAMVVTIPEDDIFRTRSFL